MRLRPIIRRFVARCTTDDGGTLAVVSNRSDETRFRFCSTRLTLSSRIALIHPSPILDLTIDLPLFAIATFQRNDPPMKTLSPHLAPPKSPPSSSNPPPSLPPPLLPLPSLAYSPRSFQARRTNPTRITNPHPYPLFSIDRHATCTDLSADTLSSPTPPIPFPPPHPCSRTSSLALAPALVTGDPARPRGTNGSAFAQLDAVVSRSNRSALLARGCWMASSFAMGGGGGYESAWACEVGWEGAWRG